MIIAKTQVVSILILALLCSSTVSYAANGSALGNVALHSSHSIGCGIIRAGTNHFISMKVRVLDQDRIFHLRVPKAYNSNRAYPLIFRWHGSGGNGLSGGLGIEYISGNDAIVVGADGLNQEWNINPDSTDLIFFDSMLALIEKQYCIDRQRIFSYGFSIGGTFTNLLACERGDVLRASASIAGWPAGSNCKGQVARWFLHDLNDPVVPITEGKAARDQALAINDCSTKAVDEGDGCVHYQGCEAAPVVWCESKGIGHNVQADFAPTRVWKFFQGFR